MEKKFRKRWIAGALAVVLCCSAFLPAGTYAAAPAADGIYQETGGETEPQGEAQAEKSEEELFAQIEADPELALTITAGDPFDVKTDFTGLNLKDGETAELKKAEAEDGAAFDAQVPGTYKCIYQVTPANGEAYLVARIITVSPREAETANGQGESKDAGDTEDGEADPEPAGTETIETEPAGTETMEAEPAETESVGTEVETTEAGEDATETEQETTETETESEETQPPEALEPATEGSELPKETETEPLTEEETALSQEELDQELETAADQETVDPESGLTLGEVMEQAVEQDVDLLAMDAGETVSFLAVNASARAPQAVNVTRGTAYYYADYGLGSYVTYKYTVQFGDITATAYCVEPSKASPGDGTYTITKLSDSKQLAKVCYYGTKASGENGFFAEKHPDFSAGKQFIITHLAVAYANGSGDAFCLLLRI